MNKQGSCKHHHNGSPSDKKQDDKGNKIHATGNSLAASFFAGHVVYYRTMMRAYMLPTKTRAAKATRQTAPRNRQFRPARR